CALWWIFEPIPIPATSLIPLAVLPLVGVLTPTQVGEAYGSPLILLLLGGFMLSTALARSGAHRRIALGMVHAFGGESPRRLIFGFMAAAAVLSMWISNTATTLMLLPIVLAITEKVTDMRMKVSLLLGVAFAANIGGVGTPIGTPPNLIFMKVYAENTGIEITFLGWMKWALPVVVTMVPITGIWLTRGLKKQMKFDLPDVGAWRSEEIRTLVIFLITAILWMTRKEPFGGWSALIGVPTANDASVALLAVVAMFLIPNGRGSRLLVWDTAVKIPWGILILFGSGICIAKAFVSSGLSVTLGAALAGLGQLPLLLMILIICLAVTFLTEVTSNTATTTLLMPILAAAATNTGIDHALIMVPAAMSASFAFMLPVATGPNAVVFGSGMLTIKQMAREGIVLNLIGAAVITSMIYLFVR
ncbi:MAG: SLC13 family permease, partial [Gammaproteobacteria bacterium]|nr:SLC13 family permease [Gammaproteobacteria bacterium]